MTLKQALGAKLTIRPGARIVTHVGWVRGDRVLLGGYEIGCIQTRRARRRTEIVTIARHGQIEGYDVDWLIRQAGHLGRDRSAA